MARAVRARRLTATLKFLSASATSPSNTFNIGRPAKCAGRLLDEFGEFKSVDLFLGQKSAGWHAVDDDRVDDITAGCLFDTAGGDLTSRSLRIPSTYSRAVAPSSSQTLPFKVALYRRFRSRVTSAGLREASHDVPPVHFTIRLRVPHWFFVSGSWS